MKIKSTILSILLLAVISNAGNNLYSSWYKDPRWNRPIIHTLTWSAGLWLVGGLIGLGIAEARDSWPAYEYGILFSIGSTIGAGVGFTGGLTYGIIRGQNIHKRNMSPNGLSINFEF